LRPRMADTATLSSVLLIYKRAIDLNVRLSLTSRVSAVALPQYIGRRSACLSRPGIRVCSGCDAAFLLTAIDIVPRTSQALSSSPSPTQSKHLTRRSYG